VAAWIEDGAEDVCELAAAGWRAIRDEARAACAEDERPDRCRRGVQ